jgi:hypothetical protein
MQDRPIKVSLIIIGTGGIVQSVYFAAYRLAAYSVKEIFDLNQAKAAALAPGAFQIVAFMPRPLDLPWLGQ